VLPALSFGFPAAIPLASAKALPTCSPMAFAAPVVVGVLRPMILLPASAGQC